MAKKFLTPIDCTGLKILNLADPTAATDAATKQYVDVTAAGGDLKGSVRAATTANITLSGAQTIDGVSVIAGDRVLVKDQSTGANNGIYLCASGAWTRTTDADTSAEVTSGFLVAVAEGTANGNTLWMLTTDDPITLATTALVFAQVGAGAAFAPVGASYVVIALDGTLTAERRLQVGASLGLTDGGANGDVTLVIATAGVTSAMLRDSAALSVIGRAANSTGVPADIAAASDNQVLRRSGTAIAFGSIVAAAVSDFDTQVRTSTLNQMTSPTADLSINSHKLTGVTDPTSAQDAATKAYVDAQAAGARDIKDSVRAATTAAGTLASSFENGDVIDGVTLATGNRILIKDQAAGAENGIYTVNASGAPTRTTDADVSAEVTAGLFVWIEEGTALADTGWLLTTNTPITLNTTALVFTQVSALGQITAGAGLTKTGATLDVGAGTGISVAADAVAIDTAVVVRKFAASIGDGAALFYVVTHNLGTVDVTVAVYDNTTPFAELGADVEHTSTNTCTIRFAVAPTSNQFRVVCHG